MYVDAKSLFAEEQDVSGTDSVTLSENVVDLGVASPPDHFRGEPMYLVIQVTTAFAGGTSCEFTLVTDSAASIATDGSASEHVSSGAYPVADLAANSRIVLALPAQSQSLERYMGVLATTVGAVSAGAITAFLTHDPDTWSPLADADN